MSSFLSIHHCKNIQARSVGTDGAPLVIEMDVEKDGYTQVTIFTGDQVLTDRLVDAINTIAAARDAELRVGVAA
jgi:hypothetical protein